MRVGDYIMSVVSNGFVQLLRPMHNIPESSCVTKNKRISSIRHRTQREEYLSSQLGRLSSRQHFIQSAQLHHLS